MDWGSLPEFQGCVSAGTFWGQEALGATGWACEERLGTHQLPEDCLKRLPYLAWGLVHL